MILDVTGVETIVITDTRGLCEPQPQIGAIGVQIGGGPAYIPTFPTPSIPNLPPGTPGLPTSIFPTLPNILPSKWYRGLHQTAEPEKWAKNWQAKMSPEQQQEAFSHGYTAITQ